MKEKGILFTAESVQKILSGKKTQTRRKAKEPSIAFGDDDDWTSEKIWRAQMARFCPYGQKGDLLWVRETWGVHTRFSAGRLTPCLGTHLGLSYRADVPGPILDAVQTDTYYVKVETDLWNHWREAKRWQKWQSPLRMPRWASRILLQVEKSYIERLHEITEADAIAEGVEKEEGESAVQGYAKKWDEINGKRAPWKGNPFVWVVEFSVKDVLKRIDPLA